MKKLLNLVFAAALICSASVFTSCTKDDNPVDPSIADNVRLTQIYIEILDPESGMTKYTATEDVIWENGLLKNRDGGTYYNVLTGETTGMLPDDYVYDGNDCIEIHHNYASGRTVEYFTYADGRLVSAVEKKGDEIKARTTINSYTDDGHVKKITLESITFNTIAEYEYTWKDGDVASYRVHYVEPADMEDETYYPKYDNIPNVYTGMPLATYITEPYLITVMGTKHNNLRKDTKYTYDHRRLVVQDDGITVSYFTYSDGITGRK